MITARNITTAKQIDAVKYRNSANVSKGIASIKIRNAANVLKTVFSPANNLAVNVPASVYGAQSSLAPTAVTTEIAGAIPSGGTAPYTYLWTRTDANPESWNIIAPTSNGTAFRSNAVGVGDTNLATFICTVTDSRGNSVASITINATAENFGGFA